MLLMATSTLLGQLPDGPATAPAELADRFDAIVGYAKWFAFVLLILAMMVAGVQMAMSHRHGDGTMAATGVMRVILGVIVVSASVSLVGLFV